MCATVVQSTYTGVYARGGPSSVEPSNELSALLDRSPADIRGVKYTGSPGQLPQHWRHCCRMQTKLPMHVCAVVPVAGQRVQGQYDTFCCWCFLDLSLSATCFMSNIPN